MTEHDADPIGPSRNPKWLRSAQVAAILDVSPKTVNRWAREGKLIGVRTVGGHRRYRERYIRGLAASMRQDATTGPAANAERTTRR